MKLLIDTNAYRAFVDGLDPYVSAIQKAETVSFSVVVLGELRAGFAHGNKFKENEAVLARVLSVKRVEVLTVSEHASVIYAKIWSALRRAGTPIPTNDVWIAAQAIENELTLLTRDRHFQAVKGLEILNTLA